MRPGKFRIFAAGCCILLASAAFADPKPKAAKVTKAQDVANFYAGMTHTWDGCIGGIYYGPNWEAQAFCSKKGDSVGLGKWRVDNKGQVCHELTWYWQEGDGVGEKSDKGECVRHLTTQDGVLWRNWPNQKDWWRATGSKKTVKGFKFKSKINRLRKKLKV